MTLPKFVYGPKLVLLLSPMIAQADIVLDGSTGSSGSIAGPNFAITEDLGARVGDNLIHSFSQFDLAAGEVATFSGSETIDNVISRVTGGSASSIDGSIISTIGDANFWFLNPNGVVFGSNAQINVPAAFIVSTASSINGNVAGALTVDSSIPATLTISDIDKVAFGVTNASSIVFDETNMTLTNGDMYLVSDSVTFNQASLDMTDGRLLSVAHTGDVSLDSLAQTEHNGVLSVTDSQLNIGLVSGGEGALAFGAGSLTMDGSSIELVATDNSHIKANAISLIDANVDVEVAARDINVELLVEADSLRLSEGSRFLTETDLRSSETLGADLVFDIENDFELDNSDLFSVVGTDAVFSTGGAIDISAGNLTLLGNGESASRGFITGTNKGDDSSLMGEFSIDVSDTFLIQNGAGIRQSLGNGGDIDISATTLRAENAPNALVPLFDGDNAPARVTIDAELIILDNANLNNRVTNNSLGGSFSVTANDLTMSNESSINTKTFGSADGININLAVDNLTLSGGSFIGASTLGSGDGGQINIRAQESITLTGTGDTFASSFRSTTADTSVLDPDLSLDTLLAREGFGTGNGGRIRVISDSIALEDGATITAVSGVTNDVQLGRTVNSGDAGRIELVANELRLDNASIETQAIESSGGSVDIRVVDFIGITDSTIETNSRGASADNPGGDIFIDPQLLVLSNARLNANANAGNGGNIDLIADNIIRDSRTLVTATSRTGIDGDISIDGVVNDVSSIALLAADYNNLGELLSQPCFIDSLEDRSSFVVEAVTPVARTPESYQLSSRHNLGKDEHSKYEALVSSFASGECFSMQQVN